MNFFSLHRYQYVRLDGTMSIKKRQKIVDRFNDPHVSGSQQTLLRFSFFFILDQDQVANIHWHCWKERLHKRKLKLTEFKGDALKASKDITFKLGIFTHFIFTHNPLRANSDQHLFSPNNIHTLLRKMVARSNQMITKEKMLCSFIKFSQLICKGNVWISVWGICMWIYWGLRG